MGFDARCQTVPLSSQIVKLKVFFLICVPKVPKCPKQSFRAAIFFAQKINGSSQTFTNLNMRIPPICSSLSQNSGPRRFRSPRSHQAISSQFKPKTFLPRPRPSKACRSFPSPGRGAFQSLPMAAPFLSLRKPTAAFRSLQKQNPYFF